jgi:hypothetical protein
MPSLSFAQRYSLTCPPGQPPAGRAAVSAVVRWWSLDCATDQVGEGEARIARHLVYIYQPEETGHDGQWRHEGG